MEQVTVRLPDGSEREYEKGSSLYTVARDISEGLARSVVGAVVNGKTKGLQEELKEDAEVRFVKAEDKEGKEIFWHTSAHIMALAVQRLFPDVKFAIGPAIENGFYYDFDTEHRFTPEDLAAIEAEMRKIVKEKLPLERSVLSRAEALDFFSARDEVYKVDLIENLPEEEEISLYSMGEFSDLCAGPHLPDSSKVKAIHLMAIAGAYWRGDEKNKMLQRIYGISFEKKKELDEYLQLLEEAKRRDHRKLGQELKLFSIKEQGPGFVFFHPNGMIMRNAIEDFWRKVHKKHGYGEIQTPIILSESLWHQSGHWDHYKENMYFTKIDEMDYAVKPMNCPGAILVYQSEQHSYRDLPIRNAELGLVHRHELSGTLHGLFRVRSFTQDDAHIFCLPSQIKDELVGVIRLADEIYSAFGFDYTVKLSTRPENSMGSDEQWNEAVDGLKAALAEEGLDYSIEEGGGAFYGPKIDFDLVDAIGRPWQCGTIQLDFQMPERFDLEYVAQDNTKKRPVMIHRAILGSLERFMGILIENYEGKFPAWIAPVQAIVLPISDKYADYAEQLVEQMNKAGLRAEADLRAEKIGYKIRAAQMRKIEYMLVVGEKEVEGELVAVREREQGDVGQMPVSDFIAMLKEEADERRIVNRFNQEQAQ